MDDRVNDLLLRWRELKEEGRTVSAEEICAACPELLPEFQRCLRAVEQMEGWFGLATNNRPAGAATLSQTIADAKATVPSAVPPFDIPGYELLEALNQGGMGIVYKARQTGLKRLCAVKMIRFDLHLKPQQLGRFKIEAEAVAKLQHPNIVQIYEVGEVQGRPYYSMEFVEGGSLAEKIAGQPLPPDAAAQLVATLAETIHFAHQRGIVHRDLKPANILLKDEGGRMNDENRHPASLLPKIADFGLAKLVNTESGLSGPGNPTQSGMIVGTPSYMAPEQAEGKSKEIGPAVDVYALGAILYEMLTGRPPFVGATPLDTLLRVVSSPPVAPTLERPQVPRDLETICLKCLEKAPEQRYPSAAALADDLIRFRKGLPITARQLSPVGRLLKWGRRHPEKAALAVLLLLIGLSLIGFAAVRYQEHQEARRAAARLAPRAGEILHRYCHHCHGLDPKATEGDLVVLDYAMLLDPARKLVVPGDAEESLLWHRVNDDSMPPEEDEEFPRLSSEEKEDLKKWIAGGAPPFPSPADVEHLPEPPPSPSALAVKQVFQKKCRECHRAGNPMNGIKILNYDLLVAKRKVVVPGQPDRSRLVELLLTTDKKKRMPPDKSPPLTADEIARIRTWIAEGAPPFPLARAPKKSG
jgi:serine/threonine protein kinase/mono/diheme cytochrome c family protein